LRGSFSREVEALEHVGLVLVHGHRAVGLGQLEGGEVLSGRVAGEDGIEDVLHSGLS